MTKTHYFSKDSRQVWTIEFGKQDRITFFNHASDVLERADLDTVIVDNGVVRVWQCDRSDIQNEAVRPAYEWRWSGFVQENARVPSVSGGTSA